jgi:hypothetical protein
VDSGREHQPRGRSDLCSFRGAWSGFGRGLEQVVCLFNACRQWAVGLVVLSCVDLCVVGRVPCDCRGARFVCCCMCGCTSSRPCDAVPVLGCGVGWVFVWQACKGAWWMPWHREPMKDVGACDKPWGVGNRAVIQGCPNGETWLESCPVTCI